MMYNAFHCSLYESSNGDKLGLKKKEKVRLCLAETQKNLMHVYMRGWCNQVHDFGFCFFWAINTHGHPLCWIVSVPLTLCDCEKSLKCAPCNRDRSPLTYIYIYIYSNFGLAFEVKQSIRYKNNWSIPEKHYVHSSTISNIIFDSFFFFLFSSIILYLCALVLCYAMWMNVMCYYTDIFIHIVIDVSSDFFFYFVVCRVSDNRISAPIMDIDK